MGMTILYALLALLLLFILFILIRAALFRPKEHFSSASTFGTGNNVPNSEQKSNIDPERAIENFRKILSVPTVSDYNPENEDEKAFTDFYDLIRELYPLVHEKFELKKIGRRGLLFKLCGRDPGKAPSVLMSHFDVVPANPEEWTHHPFKADIADGEIWARGTLDTKSTFCGVMEACEQKMREGFVPEADLYLSFSGEEEAHGTSASQIVDYLDKQGVRPGLVLDEGGAIVDSGFPGLKSNFAVVGIGEKGMMDVYLKSSASGGHASAPPKKNALSRLCESALEIVNNPLPAKFEKPVKEMFDSLGRHVSFGYRIFYANIDIFMPILKLVTKKTGGELNAMFRTTFALTQAKASDRINVIPSNAVFGLNLRTLPGDTRDSIVNHMKNIVEKNEVSVELGYESPASTYSSTDSEGFEKIKKQIYETWPGTPVSPYLMMVATDSRHFHRISDSVYCFCPMEMPGKSRSRIHGVDERIGVEAWKKTLKFYEGLVGRL